MRRHWMALVATLSGIGLLIGLPQLRADGPATRPEMAGPFPDTVVEQTILRRVIGGKPEYDILKAGQSLEVLSSHGEFALVVLPDGRRGEVPIARILRPGPPNVRPQPPAANLQPRSTRPRQTRMPFPASVRVEIDAKKVAAMKSAATDYLLNEHDKKNHWEAPDAEKRWEPGLATAVATAALAESRVWNSEAVRTSARYVYDQKISTPDALAWLGLEVRGIAGMPAAALKSILPTPSPAVVDALTAKPPANLAGPPAPARPPVGQWPRFHELLRPDIGGAMRLRRLQRRDGSWGDEASDADGTTVTLTAKAATALITQQLGRRPLSPFDMADESVEAALLYFDAQPPETIKSTATLLALQEFGWQTGRRNFAQLDVFGHGVAYLATIQNDDGSFGDAEPRQRKIHETALALLFLVRGDAPVAVGKYLYDAVPPDVHRVNDQEPGAARADAARWTKDLSDTLDRPLRWQYVSPASDAADLAECTVLLITGAHAMSFDPVMLQQMRTYVEQGGTIVAVPNLKLDTQMLTELGKALYPKRELRALPEKHAILDGLEAEARPAVLGMSDGKREVMLILPTDPWRSFRDSDRQLLRQIWHYARDQRNKPPAGAGS